jgi:hypothetical protein
LELTVNLSATPGIAPDFERATDMLPARGENNILLTGFTQTGQTLIAKMSLDADTVWAKTVGGGSGGRFGDQSIQTDNRGNVYIAGAFADSGFTFTADFDPGPDEVLLSTAGHYDVFVLRLDRNGNFVWVRRVGGDDMERPGGLALDSEFNLHVTGIFRGRVDFRPGPGQFFLDGKDTFDAFVLSLSRAGEFRSAFQIGGKKGSPLSLMGRLPTVSIRGAQMVIGGSFHGPLDFDPTRNQFVVVREDRNIYDDIFVAKYPLAS